MLCVCVCVCVYVCMCMCMYVSLICICECATSAGFFTHHTFTHIHTHTRTHTQKLRNEMLKQMQRLPDFNAGGTNFSKVSFTVMRIAYSWLLRISDSWLLRISDRQNRSSPAAVYSAAAQIGGKWHGCSDGWVSDGHAYFWNATCVEYDFWCAASAHWARAWCIYVCVYTCIYMYI